jgi:hypothetical protein
LVVYIFQREKAGQAFRASPKLYVTMKTTQMPTPEDGRRNAHSSNLWWSRVAQAVDSYRALERETWGGIDEDTLLRYMGDECTVHERLRVEQAMGNLPAIREAIDLHLEVMEELGLMTPSIVATPKAMNSFLGHPTPSNVLQIDFEEFCLLYSLAHAVKPTLSATELHDSVADKCKVILRFPVMCACLEQLQRKQYIAGTISPGDQTGKINHNSMYNLTATGGDVLAHTCALLRARDARYPSWLPHLSF